MFEHCWRFAEERPRQQRRSLVDSGSIALCFAGEMGGDGSESGRQMPSDSDCAKHCLLLSFACELVRPDGGSEMCGVQEWMHPASLSVSRDRGVRSPTWSLCHKASPYRERDLPKPMNGRRVDGLSWSSLGDAPRAFSPSPASRPNLFSSLHSPSYYSSSMFRSTLLALPSSC